MFVDYVMNTGGGLVGQGPVGARFAESRFDAGLMRPYIDAKGRHCITVNTGRMDGKGRPVLMKQLVSHFVNNTGIVVNGPTSLRKDEWMQLDRVVLTAARDRLRAWSDLAASNLYSGFNGMGKMFLEHEMMSDPGEAFVDFDMMTEGRNDAPEFQNEGLPLPITHAGFWFSSRKLAISRNSGTPIDTVMGEAAGRRVAEKIEDTLIGVIDGLSLTAPNRGYTRQPTVYGYTNFPDRILKVDMTTPTGANPDAVHADIIEMRELAYAAKFYGPFMLYHTPAYDAYLDRPFGVIAGSSYGFAPTQTLRQMVKSIDGIRDVRRLDRWSGSPYQMLLVQMTSNVARAVQGMDLTTVQWESMGGARLNFRVMCIMVPQLRSDINGDTGIVHGTTS